MVKHRNFPNQYLPAITNIHINECTYTHADTYTHACDELSSFFILGGLVGFQKCLPTVRKK